ncbi:serine-rich adhesin for platelets-like isoform X2 [Centruroides vittatus]|uniref:serine-rich adhesin for platelets-like isoform X2 n=1 Tax=Centruroides vittatus TaxID=120091 RepID=UPI00350EE3FB
METKDFSALGGLFQLIIGDLKGGIPAWEDFLNKASKFHSQLKATVLASGAFLDSFQKIADMATSARGATKDIGSALTRLCLRHRSVETKFKSYASSLLDCLIIPLQDRMEEWKKVTYQLDKDYNKEYKRVRQEIKKKSTDTLRLQKKIRKVGICDIKRTLNSALQDVNDKYLLLEETEKQAVRKVLIEERSRFCHLVTFIEPVIKSELIMLQEMTHLQEVLESLTNLTQDPYSLPSSSEEILNDMKNSDTSWSFQTPPSSPSSLGSRKSSVCSISSLNSSSSNGTHSHSSSHRSRHWSLQQTSSLSKFSSISIDSCSSPTSPVVSTTSVTSTWPSTQDSLKSEHLNSSVLKNQRPHTISSAYEHSGHVRPALTVQTFQPLNQEKNICKENYYENTCFSKESRNNDHGKFTDNINFHNRNDERNHSPSPPIPKRNIFEEKDKPYIPDKSPFVKAKHIQQLLLYGSPSKSVSVPDFNKTPSDQVMPNPIYANINDFCLKIPSKTASLPTRYHGCNKLSFQKDLASALSKSYLYHRSDEETNKSEDKKIFEKKVSGVSSTSEFSHSKGLSTLQKTGNSNKPPTPVRRSSSISSQSLDKITSHQKNTDYGVHIKKSSEKVQTNTDNQKSEKSQFDSKTDNSDVNKTYKSTDWEEKDLENDVFERRTRFLQALNATLTFQNRQKCQDTKHGDEGIYQNTEGRKQIQAMVLQFQNQAQSQKPILKQQIFPRSTSDNPNSQVSTQQCNEKSIRNSFTKHNTSPFNESNKNLGTNYNTKRENSVQSFNSKTTTKLISHQIQRKTSLPDPSPNKEQSTSNYKNPECFQKCLIQPAVELKLSAQVERSGSSPLFPVSALVENKSFIASLNAKLAKQSQFDEKNIGFKHSTHSWGKKRTENAYLDTSTTKVHRWLSRKDRMVVSSCCETLMDQIRRGTSLRKVICNDRSAPKLS